MNRVIAFVDDLMFLSRIREAARPEGVELRAVRSVAQLREACRTPPRLLLLDLDSPRVPSLEALAWLRAEPDLAAVPAVGFLGHEEAERARQARQAGCTRVLARSAFVRELPAILSAATSR